MSLSVDGIAGLAVLLQQTGDRAVKGATSEMRRIAHDLKDIAVLMAPVDEGNLERALEVRELGGGRNERGQFQTKVFEVGVNEDIVVAVDKKGTEKRVGDYAYLIHENLYPYGHWQLGPKSQAKNGTSEYPVGGGYITRAMEVVDVAVPARMQGAIELSLLGTSIEE